MIIAATKGGPLSDEMDGWMILLIHSIIFFIHFGWIITLMNRKY